jgi:hypothetical protein
LEPEEAVHLLGEVGPEYGAVIRPYLVGEDIAIDPLQRPSRFIIDFGSRSLAEASKFPAALDIVRARVLPNRSDEDGKVLAEFRSNWWCLWRSRPEFRAAVDRMPRYIAGTATGKRFLFAWADIHTCPSNATNVFAFDDDYAMGILLSSIHLEWARQASSTMRTDVRYTPSSAFETFPFPPVRLHTTLDAVAKASRELLERRSQICRGRGIGLTTLYNALDEGGDKDLGGLHQRVDETVAAAYGWPRSAAHDVTEANTRLLELNRAITAREIDYLPFS